MSSGKWRPFCLGLNELNCCVVYFCNQNEDVMVVNACCHYDDELVVTNA